MEQTARENRQPLLVLAGPTAAGKSALALIIAPMLRTGIICADSAQVYRHLDIGTAKPTVEEQRKVPHHLIDLVEPDRDFSVADYQRLAYSRIDETAQRGRLPFLVGGTGLYINAVIDCYAFGNTGKSASIRGDLAARADAEGTDALHRELALVDRQAAERIHPRDRRRIIRALEVYQREGAPISGQVEQTRKRQPRYNPVYFGLQIPRALLYKRIDDRVDAMIEQGFIDEVRELLESGYLSSSPGLRILGYRQLVKYLEGGVDLDGAIREIKQHTRNLAKRQVTWFRRDRRINWVEISENTCLDSIAEIIYSKVKEILPVQANSIVQVYDWREPD